MTVFHSEIYAKRTRNGQDEFEFQGYCTGVFLSKTTGEIRRIVCRLPSGVNACLPVSSIEKILEGKIFVKNMKTSLPTNRFFLTPDLPVYSSNADYLGFLTDVDVRSNTVNKLIVGNKKYPAAALNTVQDAVFLKPTVYPVGEWANTEKANVTGKLLKEKIRQGSLIGFTLSLSPFSNG
jgi:hypothetical protein